MNKYALKIVFYLIFTIISFFCFAQDSKTTGSGDFESEQTDDAIFVMKSSRFKVAAHYYGLPLSIKLGWFYRKSDFSVFPNAGLSFFVDDGMTLNTTTGLILQKKYFTWEVNAAYDILPFSMRKSESHQIFYAINNFCFNINGIKIGFPLRAGRKLRLPDSENQGEKVPVIELNQGISADFFLADYGFFKSTGRAAFFTGWIPKDNFTDYKFSFDLNATFYLYHADIALGYSFFNADYLQFKGVTPKYKYETAKSADTITGRYSFKDSKVYTQMHFFGMELRWYPARTKMQANGFFLSLFTDAGFGITRNSKSDFLIEYGIGGGYTLLDCVPFTFQAGFNQKLQPVFYLSVVSRLSHLP